MEKRTREIFPGLLGNANWKDTLAADLADGKSAHAYLLVGPPGSGKHTIARLICQAALCENRENAAFPLPCGTCPTCRKIADGVCVDVMTVSNGERATIGVEAIRQVRQTLYVTPNDGAKKIYLIENAHLMTAQAQNALLLSLEEPPPYVMFLLLTEDASLLLETVRSRAPALKMELFSPEFVAEHLMEQKHLTPVQRERIPAVSHLCGGSLGRAMELLDHGSAELALYQSAEELARLLLTGKKSDTLAYLAANTPKEREQTRGLLTLLRFALRDLLSAKKGGDLLFFTEPPAYLRKISVRRVLELSDAVVQAEADLAANGSQNTVLTALACGDSR
ncbi:MAG: ATP-binding protein [Eubacteriales bacterium]